MVGDVRASSSLWWALTGDTRKYRHEVATLKSVAMNRLRNERFISSKSWMPTARPMPMMGPMSGEMSMAPIITAVELTLRPSEAMKMATMRMRMLMPRNDTPSRMDSSASAWGMRKPVRSKNPPKRLRSPLSLSCKSCNIYL